jgi:glucokinase
MPSFIGVDLGATRLRAARFSADLDMEQRTETLTLAADGHDAITRRMIEQIKVVWPKDSARIGGIGVSIAGTVDPKTSVVITSEPNLPGWQRFPLGEVLADEFHIPITLGNDGNLAALAETTMGAARGYQDVLFLTISTGIGGGIISGGKLIVGATGIGAECGLIVLAIDGDKVYSPEEMAAGSALATRARAAIERGERSTILERAGGSPGAITARDVGEAAISGDPLAIRLVEESGRVIGLTIVSFLHILNPQIVVLGGSVAEGVWDLIQKPMHEAIQRYALDKAYWEDLVISRALLGENVSLIGAAALARNQVGGMVQ